MSIRSKLRDESQRYTARDEEVQQVIWATNMSPPRLYSGAWILSKRSMYRAIICTDRRLLLLEGGSFGATVERMLEAVDRNQRLGPPKGILYCRISVFEENVYVARRFFKDIRLADAAVDESNHL